MKKIFKTIGILYDDSCSFKGKRPFPDFNSYRDYKLFINEGKKHGLNLILAPYSEYHNKKFNKAWIFTNRWQTVNNVKLDAVLDKVDGPRAFKLKKQISKELPMLNNHEFDWLCTDKWLTYKKWPQYSSRTVLGNKARETAKFKGDLIVAKPRMEASGKGIVFVDKKKIMNFSKDYILQEFIKGGSIFGKKKGQHDLRAYVCNGQILHLTLRQPSKHKYLCNFGQGGIETLYSTRQIPVLVKKMAKKIDKDLRKYKARFYSIDSMLNEQGKPILIELNSRPALSYLYDLKVMKKVHRAMCLCLLGLFK